MNGLIMAGQLILGLSLLVLLHELGHFLAARAFGIRVTKFYLFFDAFGVKLFSFKIGETEYGMGWLPFGGYCQIAGMIDESMNTEQMKQEPQSWEFRSKPAWQRLIVLVGGVFMNLITGVVIFSALLLFNEKEYLSVKTVSQDGIYASALGKEIGFQDGDKIIALNGKDVERFRDIQSPLTLMGATLTVERNGEQHEVVVPKNIYKQAMKTRDLLVEPFNFTFIIDSVLPGYPAAATGIQKNDIILSMNDTATSSYGNFRAMAFEHRGMQTEITVLRGSDTLKMPLTLDSNGIAGMTAKTPYAMTSYNVGSALAYGWSDAIDMIVVNAKGIGKLFTGEEKAQESLQGPIGIASIYGAVWMWARFWYITGLLSLILAFMNILPIPALDGGHILFTLYEMITRRKPSDKFLEYAQTVGMVIVFGLMIFAVGNDLLKLFK